MSKHATHVWVTLAVLAAPLSRGWAQGDEPVSDEPPALVEPLFVDGVMPPGAWALSASVGASDDDAGLGVPHAFTVPALQVEVPLGDRLGVAIVAAAEEDGRGRLTLPAPTLRAKWLAARAADGRAALVVGALLTPSLHAARPAEAAVTLGGMLALRGVTLELLTGVSWPALDAAPELLAGASAGVALASGLRALAEVMGEVAVDGAERELSAGPVLSLDVADRATVSAGVLVGLLPGTAPYQVLVQVKREL